MSGNAEARRVFLSLGSNTGDREANLREAVARLEDFMDRIKVSSIYETAPLYVIDQPYFLNCVARGFILTGARELLMTTQAIERAMGRNYRLKGTYGPRPIDIDILLCGSVQINEEDLIVPHPLITERIFVLVPLTEIEPELPEPASGRLYADFIRSCKDQEITLYKSW
jgi:2-amino-4-hydroxy-6-hydroxymethyldihydropteridine diphosphokinase